jgi:hypothetical protein
MEREHRAFSRVLTQQLVEHLENTKRPMSARKPEKPSTPLLPTRRPRPQTALAARRRGRKVNFSHCSNYIKMEAESSSYYEMETGGTRNQGPALFTELYQTQTSAPAVPKLNNDDDLISQKGIDELSSHLDCEVDDFLDSVSQGGPKGDRVVLSGLTSEAGKKMNGKRGFVRAECCDAKGRWPVILDNGAEKAFGIEHLMVLDDDVERELDGLLRQYANLTASRDNKRP